MSDTAEAFTRIFFDDDADEVKTWKGLALSAIMDMRRYAHDETPSRRLVSVEAYEADAVRLADGETEGTLRAKFVQAILSAWDKRRPTQTSSMSIEAASACINVLKGD